MLGAAVGLLLLSLYWLRPAGRPKHPPPKMTAGDASGLRHKLALEFAKEAAGVGITIEVQATSGSEAALEGLKNGEFDLAFVQGGLATQNMTHVRQLTAMHIEPLHLLIKAESYERIAESGMHELSGLTVNLGPVGSGTQILATEVLRFAGLNAVSDSVNEGYRGVSMTYLELHERPRKRCSKSANSIDSASAR